MCGFFLSIDDAAADVRRHTESIRHRGPDSTKYYAGARVACGFNRLAIVDNDARSDQPMVDPQEHHLLLFNGEIYNHDELRRGLQARHGAQFVTRSDTEVLFEGLICEGPQFASRLDGIFAFAFVDLQSLDVLIGRDVFGVKPLYYYSKSTSFYVSSEVKPLWRNSGESLCRSNIARLLSYGVVGNGETIVTGISELEPNTIKRFNAGACKHSGPIHEFDHAVSDSADVEELRTVLYDTIEMQQPEIPYGVLFSGGIDSTIILDGCVNDANFAGAYSVDINNPAMSERRWQQCALDTFTIEDKYRRIELNKDDLSIGSLSEISAGLDNPIFHPNFVGAYLIARKAKEDALKVLISGEGADELFLGYRWFFADQKPAEFLEYVPLADIAALLGETAVAPVDTDGMTLLEIFQKIYLQRWLARQDLTGMANSVEVRVPFLGKKVADFANKLSMEAKRGSGEAKWMLKEMLAPKFSGEFLNRKKMGFDFPLNDWMDDEHVDFLRQKSDLFDPAVLNAVLDTHRDSYFRNRLVFSCVSLALWMEA